MGKADGDFSYAQLSGAGACPAMQVNQRSVSLVAQNLDIAPGDTSPACAQCLHHCLFASEAHR
jgi:hypothetical protein